MSAQQIEYNTLPKACIKIDEYLSNFGFKFLDIYSYDLQEKVDFRYLSYIVTLQDILERDSYCSEITEIINRIL